MLLCTYVISCAQSRTVWSLTSHKLSIVKMSNRISIEFRVAVKTKIRIDRESGLAYIAKALRKEGFVGEVVGLANARTLTLIMPGSAA